MVANNIQSNGNVDPRALDRRRFMQLAGAGGAVFVAGCTGGNGDDDAEGMDPDDEDALTLMTYEPLEEGDPTEQDDPVSIQVGLNYLIEEFEAETGITIEHQDISIGEWRTQMGTILSGDGAPAVSENMGGPGQFGNLVHADQLLELSEYVDPGIIEARDVSNFQFEDGNILDFAQGDDIYGIPHYMSGLPLWFNIPVLEDAGVDYERLRHANDVTWDEFDDICEQILDAGYTPMAFGNSNGGHIPYKFSVAVNKTVGHEHVYEALDPGSDVQMDDEEFVEALELVNEWWENDYINDDHLALQEDEGQSYFFQGEAAFMSDGIWISYLWDAVADPEEMGPMGEGWDYMWWPYRPDVYEEGQNELLGFNVGAYSISSQLEGTDLLDDAVEWLDWYMSDEIAIWRGENIDRIPSHEEAPATAGPVQEAMSDDLKGGENVQALRTDDILLPEFGETLNSAGQQMFEGDLTPQEVLTQAQESLEEGLERYS